MRGVVIFAVAIALAACAREADRAPADAPAAAPTTVAAEPVDLTATEVEATIPIGGPSFVTAMHVGSSVNAGGALDAETDRFAPGSPIVVILDLRDSPAGAAANVVIRRGDRVLAEQRKEIPEGAPRVSFTFTDTRALPRGELTLEAFMGGSSAGEKTIVIGDRQ